MEDFVRRTTVLTPEPLLGYIRPVVDKAAAVFADKEATSAILRMDTRWLPQGGTQVGIGIPNRQFERWGALADTCAEWPYKASVGLMPPVPPSVRLPRSKRELFLRAVLHVLSAEAPRFVSTIQKHVMDEIGRNPGRACPEQREYYAEHTGQTVTPAGTDWVRKKLGDAASQYFGNRREESIARLQRAILGVAIATRLEQYVAKHYDDPDALRALNERIAAAINPPND